MLSWDRQLRRAARGCGLLHFLKQVKREERKTVQMFTGLELHFLEIILFFHQLYKGVVSGEHFPLFSCFWEGLLLWTLAAPLPTGGDAEDEQFFQLVGCERSAYLLAHCSFPR